MPPKLPLSPARAKARAVPAPQASRQIGRFEVRQGGSFPIEICGSEDSISSRRFEQSKLILKALAAKTALGRPAHPTHILKDLIRVWDLHGVSGGKEGSHQATVFRIVEVPVGVFVFVLEIALAVRDNLRAHSLGDDLREQQTKV